MSLSERSDHEPQQWEIVQDALGFPGAMLSGVKRAPHGCEDHTIYWNACVFDAVGVQIWHGDLDVTASVDRLQALADRIGTVYVTPEQPWRWDGFDEVRKDRRHAGRVIEFKTAKA